MCFCLGDLVARKTECFECRDCIVARPLLDANFSPGRIDLIVQRVERV